MKAVSKLTFFALCAGVVYCLASSVCEPLTDNFSVARIHSDLPYNPAWETAPLSEEKMQELDSALQATFHYLGCGGQCFAFASDDGKYVIKFFKHRIRKPYSYFLNTPLAKRKLEKAVFKLNRDFTSYKIAYEELREETRVLYIHLNKGTALNRSVAIVDKLGIRHTIPLDDIEFVVQARAQLAYDHIDELMERGDIEAARGALRGILDVIASRCKKGIFDEDPSIHRNLGFIADKPIFIDVGRFVHDQRRMEPAVYLADLGIVTKRFRSDLQDTHPELVSLLDEELHAFEN